MAFEESQRWYTLRAEVSERALRLDKGANAMIRNRSSKLYRTYRGDARLEIFSPAGSYAATYSIRHNH
jgi:hypothetical protein